MVLDYILVIMLGNFTGVGEGVDAGRSPLRAILPQPSTPIPSQFSHQDALFLHSFISPI
jgi:hypothetical protein